MYPLICLLFSYEIQKNVSFGGNQIRPNIHINDIVNVFFHFLQNPEIKSGAYNAGSENIKILDIAKKVNMETNARIYI